MDVDPKAWSPWIWGAYALGALYLGGFVAFFFVFRRAERRAKTGRPDAIERYNRLLRGLPNAIYAKMLGRHPIAMPDAARSK
jgi:hypothetical protein